MHWDDEKISQLFQDAKHADEQRAPSFERTLIRSRQRHSSSAAWKAAIAAAVVLLLATFALLRPRLRPAAPPTELQASLLQWRSPTDFLLQTPGHELRDSLPRVGRVFTLDGNGELTASQSKGENR